MPAIVGRSQYEGELQRILNRIHLRALKGLLQALPLDLFGDAGYSDVVFTAALPLWSVFYEQLRDDYIAGMSPVLVRVHAQQSRVLVSQRGVMLNDDEVDDRSREWVGLWLGVLAHDMISYAQKKIDGFIATFRARSELGLGWLRERLGRLFSPSRAQSVAITEVTRAGYEGEKVTAQELRNRGLELLEVWITANDERVCEYCGPNHNRPRGRFWQVPPPLHPGCRCYIEWLRSDELAEFYRMSA